MGPWGYSAREGVGAPKAGVVTAQVLLGEELVGYLAAAGDQVAFTFDGAYLVRADRAVLGQAFEDRDLSTVAYPHLHRRLALGLVDSDATTSAALTEVSYAGIRELATWAGEPPDAIESEVRDFVARARAAWRDVRSLAPEFVAGAVDLHLETVAL